MTNPHKSDKHGKILPQESKEKSGIQLQLREAIYLALHQVPSGRVITYGGLARLANLPNAARLVGSCLRELPADTRLPWHRVINAQGKISLPPNSPGYLEQLRRLQNEGIELQRERVNLLKYLWP